MQEKNEFKCVGWIIVDVGRRSSDMGIHKGNRHLDQRFYGHGWMLKRYVLLRLFKWEKYIIFFHGQWVDKMMDFYDDLVQFKVQWSYMGICEGLWLDLIKWTLT